jgi:hypothetical protein
MLHPINWTQRRGCSAILAADGDMSGDEAGDDRVDDMHEHDWQGASRLLQWRHGRPLKSGQG